MRLLPGTVPSELHTKENTGVFKVQSICRKCRIYVIYEFIYFYLCMCLCIWHVLSITPPQGLQNLTPGGRHGHMNPEVNDGVGLGSGPAALGRRGFLCRGSIRSFGLSGNQRWPAGPGLPGCWAGGLYACSSPCCHLRAATPASVGAFSHPLPPPFPSLSSLQFFSPPFTVSLLHMMWFCQAALRWGCEWFIFSPGRNGRRADDSGRLPQRKRWSLMI